MSKILVTRSSMPAYDEYCAEIKELWESHWLTNMGAKHSLIWEFLMLHYIQMVTLHSKML